MNKNKKGIIPLHRFSRLKGFTIKPINVKTKPKTNRAITPTFWHEDLYLNVFLSVLIILLPAFSFSFLKV